jgi:hypothetical protein
MTFVANTALTAAQLNTHLRDNLMETATAKATAAGQFFIASGRNTLETRTPASSFVVTLETASDTGTVNLTTPGPAVTVTTGTRALVFFSMQSSVNNVGGSRSCAYIVTGASDIDRSSQVFIRQDGQQASGRNFHWFMADLIEDLTPGVNTFTMTYSVGSGTVSFSRRRITVWPL